MIITLENSIFHQVKYFALNNLKSNMEQKHFNLYDIVWQGLIMRLNYSKEIPYNRVDFR